jgi:predicted XRE-type DNA-binding protein
MSEPSTGVSLDDPFVSVGNVALMFDVTQATVRQWIKQDLFKAVKINGSWRVRQSELNRFAEQKFGDNA